MTTAITYKSVEKHITKKARQLLLWNMFILSNPLLLKRKYIPEYSRFVTFYRREYGFFKSMLLILYVILIFLGKESFHLRKIIKP